MRELIKRYENCFVCGDKNQIGLRVDFFYEEGRAKAEFTPSLNHEGYADTLHGGLIAALLDEVMIKSILAEGIISLTTRLEVRFKRKARVGEKLFLEGWVEKKRGRIIFTKGRILVQNEDIIAEAEGAYFRER